MRKTALVIVGALMMVSWGASAQDDAPALVSIRLVDTVPGKAAQFEAALKKYGEALKKVTPDQGMNVRNIAVGGPGSRYVVFRQLAKPSDQRQRPILVEAFGEEAAATIAASFDESIAETRVENFVPREDLSRRPTDLEGVEIVLVIRVQVVNGRQQAFEDYIHKLVEATDKVAPDAQWFGYAPGIGAGTIYRFAIPQKWADLDNPQMPMAERMMKHFGDKEGAALFAANLENVVEVTNGISVNRADLSVQPAE